MRGTVFDEVNILIRKGLSIKEAIERVESIQHHELPLHIINLIHMECGK